MWHRVERLIRALNECRRSLLKSGGTWHTLVCWKIVLKLFNLSFSSKEL